MRAVGQAQAPSGHLRMSDWRKGESGEGPDDHPCAGTGLVYLGKKQRLSEARRGAIGPTLKAGGLGEQ